MPLSLRRGRVTAITERHDALVRLEVDGVPCVAYSVGDRAGRARGRGARQRPGARARARLRRLRRALREPDARARASGRGGRARDGAAVHAAAARARVRRGVRRARGGAARAAGRLLLAAQPGRAGLRGARRPARRLRPARRAERCRSRSRTPCGRCASGALVAGTAAVAPCFDADVQCVSVASALAWARREHDVAVCSIGPGIVGTGHALRARRARRGGGRQRGARARRRAGDRGARLGRRRAAAPPRRSRITPRRCSRSSAARRSSPRTARAGARPATACRSRTWAAAPTTTRSSSRPPTPPASPRATSRADCHRSPPSRTTVRPASSPRRSYPGRARVSVTLRAGGVTVLPQLVRPPRS